MGTTDPEASAAPVPDDIRLENRRRLYRLVQRAPGIHLREVVRALIRRSHATSTSALVHGRLRLDMAGRRLYCDDQPVDLSARELAVIELLLLKEGKVVTKQQIVDHLYGWDDESTSNAVEVFVYRLRKKLEATGVDIRTVRGMGYLIEKHAA